MFDAAQKMGISKTVYSGIYTSARIKISSAFIRGEIIQIEEETPNITTNTIPPKPKNTKAPAKKKLTKKEVINSDAEETLESAESQDMSENKKSKKKKSKKDKKPKDKKKSKKGKKKKKK